MKFSSIFLKNSKLQQHFLTLPDVIFQKIGFDKQKRGEVMISLDIGTEAVKVLIFKKEETSKEVPQRIIILGAALQYLDSYERFDTAALDIDVIKKSITLAIKEAQRRSGVETNSVLLGISPDKLKAEVSFQSFERQNPEEVINKEEEQEILSAVFKKSQKEISQIFTQKTGILLQEIQFIDSEILEIKIDGYHVPSLLGFKGKLLDFEILTFFLPRYYLQIFQKITQDLGLNLRSITHEAKGLKDYISSFGSQGVFLDIGGGLTQIFLAKDEKLRKIKEFKIGGEAFTQILSQTLGLNLKRAKILKERYSQKELSEPTRERIKEIFSAPLQDWFSNLKLELLNQKTLISPTIFLFGGGSMLPEIVEILSEGDWNGIFQDSPKIKFISAIDLKNIEDKTGFVNTPQYIPALLLILN